MIQMKNISYVATRATSAYRRSSMVQSSTIDHVKSVSVKHRDALLALETNIKNIAKERSLSTGRLSQGPKDETTSSSEKIREFIEVPEAKGLPLIGTLLDYTPLRGFEITRIFDLWKKRHDQYGNIYREKLGGKSAVFCRTKEDTEKMFRAEGRMPFRAELEGLRLVKKMMDLPELISNLKDEEWYKMRQPLNDLLMKNKMIWKYAPDMLNISEELCTYIENHRDKKGEVPNFDSVLDNWAFEMSGLLFFNTRFGMLSSDSPEDIIEAFEGMKKMMNLTAEAFFGSPLWRYKSRKALERDIKRTREVFRGLIEIQKGSAQFSESVLGGIYAVDDLNETYKIAYYFILYYLQPAHVVSAQTTMEFRDRNGV